MSAPTSMRQERNVIDTHGTPTLWYNGPVAKTRCKVYRTRGRCSYLDTRQHTNKNLRLDRMMHTAGIHQEAPAIFYIYFLISIFYHLCTRFLRGIALLRRNLFSYGNLIGIHFRPPFFDLRNGRGELLFFFFFFLFFFFLPRIQTTHDFVWRHGTGHTNVSEYVS